MVRVQEGNVVKVHYTGSLEDGTVFDSSIGKEPLELETGREMYLPHFERAIIGMAIGEIKRTTLPPEQAFGTYQLDLATTIDKSEFSDRGIEPAVGLKLEIPQPGKSPLEARVTDISDSTVKRDANHPLAGKTVTLDIELVAIL